MFKTILCPTDGSTLSLQAAEKTLQFAKENGSTVVGLFVEETYPYFPYGTYTDKDREQIKATIKTIIDKAAEIGVAYDVHYAKAANPSEEIIKMAEQLQCDSIFLASHGVKGIDRLLLGSVTQKILLASPIPVVVLK